MAPRGHIMAHTPERIVAMADEAAQCGIRFTSAHIVHRAPQFTRDEIDYIQGIMSGRLCLLSRLAEQTGKPLLEHQPAGEIYVKLHQLQQYMDAVEASE